jgi:hypothetical protein
LRTSAWCRVASGAARAMARPCRVDGTSRIGTFQLDRVFGLARLESSNCIETRQFSR